MLYHMPISQTKPAFILPYRSSKSADNIDNLKRKKPKPEAIQCTKPNQINRIPTQHLRTSRFIYHGSRVPLHLSLCAPTSSTRVLLRDINAIRHKNPPGGRSVRLGRFQLVHFDLVNYALLAVAKCRVRGDGVPRRVPATTVTTVVRASTAAATTDGVESW